MIRDLYGREIKKGQVILLKNVENLPFEVTDVTEGLSVPTPAGMQPLAKVHLVLSFEAQVLGPKGIIQAFITKQPEEKNQDKKLVL